MGLFAIKMISSANLRLLIYSFSIQKAKFFLFHFSLSKCQWTANITKMTLPMTNMVMEYRSNLALDLVYRPNKHFIASRRDNAYH